MEGGARVSRHCGYSVWDRVHIVAATPVGHYGDSGATDCGERGEQVQPDQMHLTFVGAEGQHLYTYTRQRRRNSSARPLGSAAQPSRLAGGGTAKSKNTKTVRLAACMKRCVMPHPPLC